MRDIQQTVPEQVTEKLMFHFQDGWKTLFANGKKMQEDVLMDILQLGRDSAYAHDHGFDHITTWEEFQSKIPISEYKDYKPYIEANMQDDQMQLIGIETNCYLSTTGTTGEMKYFPESRIGALARQLVIDVWNLVVAGSVKQMTDPEAKMLAVVNCWPLNQAQNGKSIIRASGQAGKTLWEQSGDRYIFPYAFLEARMSDEDQEYLTALYALKEKNLSLLFCNNLIYFGDLLDYIAERPQQMINDIRQGYMTADLKDVDREILKQSFLPDVGRADNLQALLDQYGYLPIEKIWPAFSFIGTWLAGSAGTMGRDVLRRLPDSIQRMSEGYGATEAMMTIPMQFDCPYGVLAPFAYFYEFLPLGKDKPVSMAEVVDGAYYELIITTYSGLYRYNLHDIIRVHGFTGSTANIEFCCKSTEVWTLNSKTIYAFQLSEMIHQAEEKTQIQTSFYQGIAQNERLSVMIFPTDETFNAPVFYKSLKEIFYENGIQIGKIYVMKKSYREKLYKEQMNNGRTKQNIKVLTTTKELPPSVWIEAEYEA